MIINLTQLYYDKDKNSKTKIENYAISLYAL